MTPNYPCPAADSDRFAANGVVADATAAGNTRQEFAGWLSEHADLDEIRLSDIVLAVNEALANAAEFAYAGAGGSTLDAGTSDGTFDIEAVLDHDSGTLTVTISDQGRWREKDPNTEQRTRGRGIPLMRMLAEDVAIDRSALGTTVCLRFDQVESIQQSMVLRRVRG
jgi:anti-sigma regulatory factor (Ser/Thr protein kinase)